MEDHAPLHHRRRIARPRPRRRPRGDGRRPPAGRGRRGRRAGAPPAGLRARPAHADRARRDRVPRRRAGRRNVRLPDRHARQEPRLEELGGVMDPAARPGEDGPRRACRDARPPRPRRPHRPAQVRPRRRPRHPRARVRPGNHGPGGLRRRLPPAPVGIRGVDREPRRAPRWHRCRPARPDAGRRQRRGRRLPGAHARSRGRRARRRAHRRDPQGGQHPRRHLRGRRRRTSGRPGIPRRRGTASSTAGSRPRSSPFPP